MIDVEHAATRYNETFKAFGRDSALDWLDYVVPLMTSQQLTRFLELIDEDKH